MMKNLRGKRCLITGAASGIGRAAAVLAAKEGAELLLTDVDARGLDAVVQELRASGGRVRVHRAFDVSDYEAVAAFAAKVHAEGGSVDVIMNVAGIAIWGAVEDMKHEDWRRVVDVNLMGPIHVIETFLPPMIRSGRGGHLVNVSSAAGLFGLPWHAAYSASKFGVRGLSEVLRFDLRRHGIAVTLVCPGAVDTGLVSSVKVHGVDTSAPAFAALRKRFRSHALSPEAAARAMIEGMKRGEPLVLTSADIHVGYWFQRKFAWPYEVVMRLMNDRFHALKRAGGVR